MKKFFYNRFLWFAVLLSIGFLIPIQLYSADANPRFLSIQLNDDTINPITAEYIIRAIDRAENESAQGVIINLDTPGGLLSSTRMIVKRILNSRVPVIVYIAPGGSRAGSAGVFITYASHLAAMAPSTNIGAAHPVQLGEGPKHKKKDNWEELKELIEDAEKGKSTDKVNKADNKPKSEKSGKADKANMEPDDDPMSSKILQDTLAFIRALAEKRGRNLEWAVKSVSESSSITDEEALKLGVVELIAENQEDLLKKIDGRTVNVNGQATLISTKDAAIEKVPMDARQQFFNILANPNIAYILMILGFYGLLYEITHPGFGAPGVLGAVFLILAFYSMQTLPTNYAAVALILLGVVLLIAEAFVPGFGMLTVGGVACLVLGSFLLFETADPVMRVSLQVVVAMAGFMTLTSIFIVRSVIQALRQKVVTGPQGLIGQKGVVQVSIPAGGEGKVAVRGELWNAESSQPLKSKTKVKVIKVDGLTVTVEPL